MERNDVIHTIYEADLSVKAVYNRFFETDSCILYVVDAQERFTGVITSGIFGRGGVPSVRKDCSVIHLREEQEVWKEAERIFEKHQITTAVPVLDSAGQISYEIRKKRESQSGEFLKDFYEKLDRYGKSRFLGREVIYLREILKNQPITVIGTREQFREICGGVFGETDPAAFREVLEDPYEFMCGNRGLLIDVTLTEYSGRRDLYAYTRNGYAWQDFLKKVRSMIEMECFSRFYRVTENPAVTVKDYLQKYSDGHITISSWDILTLPMRENLRASRLEIAEQRGLYREESFHYCYRGNGVEIRERTGGVQLLMEQTDVMLQYVCLNEELRGYIPVLNFVFDKDVEIPHRRGEPIVKKKLFRLKDYVLDLEERGEGQSFYEKRKEHTAYLKELEASFRFSMTRRLENDWMVWTDCTSRLVNTENGVRKTCGQPEAYAGTVYFFGMCTIYGALVEDAYTIPSLVQKEIRASGRKYRVVNLGNEILSDMRNLKEVLNLDKNDLAVVLFPYITDRIKEQIPVIEIGEEFNRLWKEEFYGKECFMDSVQHCGDYGNRIYSKILFRELAGYLTDTDHVRLRKNTVYDIFRKNEKDLRSLYGLDAYLEELYKEKKKISGYAEKTGCIVMNCNPFTLGHRCLIECALKQVDALIVFVVQEDKSFFSFEDRFEMVKRGTCDLKRVSVIRSGTLVLSSETFPTYFKKKEVKNQEPVCVEEDLRIFAQYIAPALDIRYRFVGEEPKDYVTGMYNRAMKQILPAVSEIRVIEIPRMCIRGTIISATEVRTHYRQGNFERVREWVPKTTLDYLMKIKRGSEECKNT